MTKSSKKSIATRILSHVAAVAMTATAWTTFGYTKAACPLMTEWGEKVTPENAWRGYPRPQLVRENWVNLNGEWDYAISKNNDLNDAVAISNYFKRSTRNIYLFS